MSRDYEKSTKASGQQNQLSLFRFFFPFRFSKAEGKQKSVTRRGTVLYPYIVKITDLCGAKSMFNDCGASRGRETVLWSLVEERSLADQSREGRRRIFNKFSFSPTFLCLLF
jgi:hypothetical protein